MLRVTDVEVGQDAPEREGELVLGDGAPRDAHHPVPRPLSGQVVNDGGSVSSVPIAVVFSTAITPRGGAPTPQEATAANVVSGKSQDRRQIRVRAVRASVSP